ncbi:hypothetical protein D9Q98_004663 [Chlorella vulgaris]|uniref:Uncharacterized protein n=1 Tax=Chlorella vulgaris TaxID=3077 RepID=A0A9D4YY53_CHLVU|nr:hypothetical protein D9Q98_004663 [Chlorella vulgaris]
MATGARAVQSAFHRYERDRLAFANAIGDAARAEGNTALLTSLGAPRLLLPLLSDSADGIAVLQPLARAEEQAGDESGSALRCTMAMLAALTRHAGGVANTVAQQGGMQAAVQCLSNKEGETKEAAAWTLAHLAAHSQDLAVAVVGAGALPILLGCLNGSAADSVVRRVAASTLADITAHSDSLAAQVVEEGGVAAIASQLRQPLANDARLLCALVNISKTSSGMATEVVGAGLLQDIGRCLKFQDDTVRRQAAACLRDIARHGGALATAVADEPELLEGLASYAATASSSPVLPALLAFGFVAQSAELAGKVLAAAGAVPAILAALQSSDEPCQAAAAWTLGRIGSWGSGASAEAAAGLPRLCWLASSAADGSDLHTKSVKAVSGIASHLSDVKALASLVMQPSLTPSLLEALLSRCVAIMAKQPATRTEFATSGALAWLEARSEADHAASQQVAACLSLFPQDLLQMYSPAHASKLLAALSTDPPPTDAIAAVPASTHVAQTLQTAGMASEEPVPVQDVQLAAGDVLDGFPADQQCEEERAASDAVASALLGVPEAETQEAGMVPEAGAEEALLEAKQAELAAPVPEAEAGLFLPETAEEAEDSCAVEHIAGQATSQAAQEEVAAAPVADLDEVPAVDAEAPADSEAQGLECAANTQEGAGEPQEAEVPGQAELPAADELEAAAVDAPQAATSSKQLAAQEQAEEEEEEEVAEARQAAASEHSSASEHETADTESQRPTELQPEPPSTTEALPVESQAAKLEAEATASAEGPGEPAPATASEEALVEDKAAEPEAEEAAEEADAQEEALPVVGQGEATLNAAAAAAEEALLAEGLAAAAVLAEDEEGLPAREGGELLTVPASEETLRIEEQVCAVAPAAVPAEDEAAVEVAVEEQTQPAEQQSAVAVVDEAHTPGGEVEAQAIAAAVDSAAADS